MPTAVDAQFPLGLQVAKSAAPARSSAVEDWSGSKSSFSDQLEQAREKPQTPAQSPADGKPVANDDEPNPEVKEKSKKTETKPARTERKKAGQTDKKDTETGKTEPNDEVSADEAQATKVVTKVTSTSVETATVPSDTPTKPADESHVARSDGTVTLPVNSATDNVLPVTVPPETGAAQPALPEASNESKGKINQQTLTARTSDNPQTEQTKSDASVSDASSLLTEIKTKPCKVAKEEENAPSTGDQKVKQTAVKQGIQAIGAPVVNPETTGKVHVAQTHSAGQSTENAIEATAQLNALATDPSAVSNEEARPAAKTVIAAGDSSFDTLLNKLVPQDRSPAILPSEAVPLPPEAQFAAVNHPRIILGMKSELLPNGGSMQIRLDPPEIGALLVNVQMRDGQLTASFQTSNDDATKMLSHSLNQLKSALESQGVSVQKLQVEQAPKDHQSHNEQLDQRQSFQERHQAQQEQHRRQMMQRMWRRIAGGADPLDLVA